MHQVVFQIITPILRSLRTKKQKSNLWALNRAREIDIEKNLKYYIFLSLKFLKFHLYLFLGGGELHALFA